MRNLTFATLLLAIVAFGAFAQSTTDPADYFLQVRYAANLGLGESYINIVNTGASGNGPSLLGPGLGVQSGNICVNVYAFDPGEEMISCCSCYVTPDQVVNLGVNRDLTAKTLTGVIPTSVTVKLLMTLAGGDGTGGSSSCKNSAALSLGGSPSPNFDGGFGMAAWGTTLHSGPGGALATTETPFTPAIPGDVVSLASRCAAIIGNASTFGICNSCRAGALGATKQ